MRIIYVDCAHGLLRLFLVAGVSAAALIATAPCFADVLVADFFFNGVNRLNDASGATLAGGVAADSAGLSGAAGVAVGPDGNIYVSSQNTGQILFYDGTTGAPLPSPHSGSPAGLFGTMTNPFPPPTMPAPAPSHLIFGPDGNLYVGDFNGQRVHKFSGGTGIELADAAQVSTNVGGLVFGSDGDLYVGDFSGGAVLRVHDGVPQAFIAPGSSPLNTPAALLFLPNDDLLVVDLFGNQVLRYDSSGTYIPRFAPEDVGHTTPLPFISVPPAIPDPLPLGANFPTNSPSDIALGPDGSLLLSVLGLTYPPDNRGAILRYDLDGNLLQPPTLVNNVPPVAGLALIRAANAVTGDFDGDSDVDVSDYNRWQADFGKTVAKGLGADGNGNGIVDAADYAVWRNALPLAPAEGAAVPEPSSFAIFAVSMWLLSVRRRESTSVLRQS